MDKTTENSAKQLKMLKEIQNSNNDILINNNFNFVKWSNTTIFDERFKIRLQHGSFDFAKGKGAPIEVFIGLSKNLNIEILIPTYHLKDPVRNDLMEQEKHYHFISPAHFSQLEDFLMFSNIYDKQSGINKINKSYTKLSRALKKAKPSANLNYRVIKDKRHFELCRIFYRLMFNKEDNKRGSIISIDIGFINDKDFESISVCVIKKDQTVFQDYYKITNIYTNSGDEIEKKYVKRYLQAILDLHCDIDDEVRLIVTKQSLPVEVMKEIFPDEVLVNFKIDIGVRLLDEQTKLRDGNNINNNNHRNIYAIIPCIPLYHTLSSDVTGIDPTYERMMSNLNLITDEDESFDVLENNPLHLIAIVHDLLEGSYIDYQKLISYPEPVKSSNGDDSSDDDDNNENDDNETMEDAL